MKRFPLAPMDALYRGTSLFLLALPLAFLGAAFAVPGLQKLIFLATAAFVSVIYAWIWFYWRPSAFRLEASSLVLEFPRRETVLDATSVTRVHRYASYAEFIEEWQFGIRIGAGGLFGAFGWLKTGKGTLQMYLSRSTDLVLLEFHDRRPLLITPEDAERFVACL